MTIGEKMTKWSKEDSHHFESSEVMRELEGNVIKTIQRASILNDKIAQLAPGTDISKKTQEVKNLNEALGKTKEILRNLADDGEMIDDESVEDVDELSSKAKEEIIDQLRKMADKAILEGEYKVAYNIERTIDELNEVDILCE
jgi:DNA gyrase/topoisomerase IV subunit A